MYKRLIGELIQKKIGKGKEKYKLPKPFMERYNAEGQIIDSKNFRDYVIIK